MAVNCVGFRLYNRSVFEFIEGRVFRFNKLFIYLFGSTVKGKTDVCFAKDLLNY